MTKQRGERQFIYTVADYAGEFNLLRHERSRMIEVLNMTRSIRDAGKVMRMDERTLFRKILRHKIIQKKGNKLRVPVFFLQETASIATLSSNK